jgi:hypothetical protein
VVAVSPRPLYLCEAAALASYDPMRLTTSGMPLSASGKTSIGSIYVGRRLAA